MEAVLNYSYLLLAFRGWILSASIICLLFICIYSFLIVGISCSATQLPQNSIRLPFNTMNRTFGRLLFILLINQPWSLLWYFPSRVSRSLPIPGSPCLTTITVNFSKAIYDPTLLALGNRLMVAVFHGHMTAINYVFC